MTDYFRPTKSVIHERFGDETVIVSLRSSRYYSLQGTADAIWTLASSGRSQPQIIQSLRKSFSGDPSEIESAAAAFLEELASERLLERTSEASLSDAQPVVLSGGEFAKPVLQTYTDMEDLLGIDPIHETDETGWPNAKPA